MTTVNIKSLECFGCTSIDSFGWELRWGSVVPLERGMTIEWWPVLASASKWDACPVQFCYAGYRPNPCSKMVGILPWNITSPITYCLVGWHRKRNYRRTGLLLLLLLGLRSFRDMRQWKRIRVILSSANWLHIHIVYLQPATQLLPRLPNYPSFHWYLWHRRNRRGIWWNEWIWIICLHKRSLLTRIDLWCSTFVVFFGAVIPLVGGSIDTCNEYIRIYE